MSACSTAKIGAGIGRGENLYFAGTHGVEIVADLKPSPNEIVIDNNKFSAFLGTLLLSLLIDRRVDILIIVGASTSNCIRAAALNATGTTFSQSCPGRRSMIACRSRTPSTSSTSTAVNEVLTYLPAVPT